MIKFKSMWLLNRFISSIFPPRPDFIRVSKLDLVDISYRYCPTVVNGHNALAPFADPDIRACIHETKYHDNEKAIQLLATLLVQWLKQRNKNYLVIPVPLAKKRYHQRGYNQVTRVIKSATKDCPQITLRENILMRQRDTLPQTSLDKAARRKNIKNAFRLTTEPKDHTFQTVHLLLVDDVLTTGSTMKEAAKVLRQLKPASLTTIALAH